MRLPTELTVLDTTPAVCPVIYFCFGSSRFSCSPCTPVKAEAAIFITETGKLTAC